jgi:hypothetical protein
MKSQWTAVSMEWNGGNKDKTEERVKQLFTYETPVDHSEHGMEWWE